MGVSFGTLGLFVDSLRVLGGEAEERPGGDVSVSVSERTHLEVPAITYSLKGGKSVGNLELA